MDTKSNIRVIKRGERKNQGSVKEDSSKTGRPGAQEAAREIVANVSAWVNDFQQRQRTETARAFKSLFVEPTPSPTEI